MSASTEHAFGSTGTACPPGCRTAETVALLARWILGGLFLFMGLSKALDPVGFLKLIREYQVGAPVLSTAAALLPWFEVFAGLLLLAGIAVRGTALVLLGMLLPFTVLILKRALAVSTLQAIGLCSVRFDCGCGAGEVWICGKILENLLLMALCAWLVANQRSRFCVRFSLRKE